jgi:predicted DNA-binding protein (UPF0251 family)
MFRQLIPMGEQGSSQEGEVVISIDEVEAIRLADLESMEQEAAAEAMNVARTTFQRILKEARYKVAQSLILGHPLRVEGGAYELTNCPKCDHDRHGDCLPCHQRRHRRGRHR